MNSILQLIALFTTFLFGSSLVVIGNYSQLNPKDCGFSRVSSKVDTNCFKWHKDITSSLKRGKNVGYGDAPWMVLLYFEVLINNTVTGFKCGGSVIANQWVLTSAHCLNDSFNIKIYPGYNFTRHNPSDDHYYESNGTYIHPKYAPKYGYDLALVKMEKPIKTSGFENSICLPEKWSVGSDIYLSEYIMISGWGGEAGILNMAPWELVNYRLNSSLAWILKIENQATCMGDSGSPAWQYHMGRAVIVGVFTGNFAGDKDDIHGCSLDNTDTLPISFARITWVDTDWIKNVTQLI